MSSSPFLIKLVILGDSSVGKTNLLSRYINNNFLENTQTTTIAEFYSKDIKRNNINLKLQFWDTAGQELFRSMSNVFYKNCHGVILCYDITNKESFNHIDFWAKELLANVESAPVLMLGNKVDLEDQRTVSFEEGKSYAEAMEYLFGEVSAKEDKYGQVSVLFNQLVDDIIKNLGESFFAEQSKVSNTKVESISIKPDEETNIRRGDCCS